jgi:hypothetical protein
MKSIFYKFILFQAFALFAASSLLAQKTVAPTGNITIILGLDENCNKTIEKNEYSIANFTATINSNGINKTVNGVGGQGGVFTNMPIGTYSVYITCAFVKNGTTQNLSTTVSATIANADGAFVQAQLFPNCDIAPPPPPPPVELKCGQWRESYLTANPSLNLSGNADLRSRETVYISTLKTTVNINLDYVSAPITEGDKKNVVKRCSVKGVLKYPNGSETSFTNDHSFSIMAPGTYIISYEVRCGKEICASGTKVIICNDPIVCNCGPANNNNLKVNGATDATNGIVNNGQLIIVDKSSKTSFFKTVTCVGNVCDGYADFKVVDAAGKVWDGGRANGVRYRFTAPNTGIYTLIITEFCGNKSCNTYSYPISFKGEDKDEYYNKTVKRRWGIQVGYYRGFPKMDRTTSSKGYGTGLVGLIADLPLGYARRFHFWPQFNLYSTNYRSKATQNVGIVPTPLDVQYQNTMLEFHTDLSYAIPLKKDMFFHLYAGIGVSGYLNTCVKYNSASPAAITNWKSANIINDTVSLPGKATFGVLLDINRNWVVGLNYYTMMKQKNNDILALTKDRGVGIRVAYFFDTRSRRNKIPPMF